MRDLKRGLRERLLAERRAVPADVAAARNRALCEAVLAWPVWQQAGTVMLFAPLPDEIGVVPLIQAALAAGKVTAVPKVVRPPRVARRTIWPCRIDAFPGLLRPSTYGILEPPDGEEKRLDPAAIDLVIVPALAFSPDGYRLGYGGGFYDRLLGAPSRPAVAAGVCHAWQVRDDVPREAHDVPVDWIVTEAGVRAAR